MTPKLNLAKLESLGKGPLVRQRDLARSHGGRPETLIEYERRDPTFPRSFQLGSNTSPRYYFMPALLEWFAAKSAGKTPPDAA